MLNIYIYRNYYFNLKINVLTFNRVGTCTQRLTTTTWGVPVRRTGAPNPAGSELGLGIIPLLLIRWLWPDIFVENYKKISF